MALLEADIDGVYFAVPSSFTEADERRLVAEAAATLPVGIKLEYEGRYQAMLSHEIKNYALLTYDGKLIVHGSGLRNSQSPPFAARFLTEALAHLLRDDIASVVGLYLTTVRALRQRKYPLTDVATSTRLTKSSGDYQRSRSRLHEGQYEALLDAGRTHWEVGENVRYYKAKGGRYVWLPYEPDEIDDAQAGDNGVAPPPGAARRVGDRRDYDIKHYLHLLDTSYLSRLRKPFREEDFERLFSDKAQGLLLDRWLTTIHHRWIEASGREWSGLG